MKLTNFIFLVQFALAQYKADFYCPNNNKRYCSGNNPNGKFFNEYDYEWFTGSDPKSMFGVIFKETMKNT